MLGVLTIMSMVSIVLEVIGWIIGNYVIVLIAAVGIIVGVTCLLAKIQKARADLVIAAYESARRNYSQFAKSVLWELTEDELDESFEAFDMFT